jgi:triphosphoribosyl-dephospho-CoA synthase
MDDPTRLMPEIMALDAILKQKGHNPGTSADLTVATVFSIRLLGGLRSAPKGD